jgi:16S rRNA C967 or C1407 C5-methylase (RsmB/RsmF family)
MSLAFRVNTALDGVSVEDTVQALKDLGLNATQPYPDILPETVIVPVSPRPNLDVLPLHRDVQSYPEMVTLGRLCGEAVLSGADAYAPGISEWPRAGRPENIHARIYSDTTDTLLRGGVSRPGVVPPPDTHVFLGIGILRKSARQDVFGANASGVAVEMIRRVYSSHSARRAIAELPSGAALLQTVPSQVVGRVVAPEPGDRVLDMCAAPGGKTAHIAAILMEQERTRPQAKRGHISAIALTKRKRSAMEGRLRELGIAVDGERLSLVAGDALRAEQLFGVAAFDRVLLDAPCTGSGTRPRLGSLSKGALSVDGLHASTDGAATQPHEVSLQRRLLAVAARVVRPGGVVVYSTCSDRRDEGEDAVAWVLAREAQLGLRAVECWPGSAQRAFLARNKLLARHGNGDGHLQEAVADLCIRFEGHRAEVDDELNVFTAFFIAKFVKT